MARLREPFYKLAQKHMIDRDLKQGDVASMTGICKSTLSPILGGRRDPSHKNLLKIMDALGIDFIPREVGHA